MTKKLKELNKIQNTLEWDDNSQGLNEVIRTQSIQQIFAKLNNSRIGELISVDDNQILSNNQHGESLK